uniref:Pollen Ole e 1 allergen and extensin family protein n=1 Tax=Salix viminalis TaxID=40686 RepID=A0A6N2KA45_SALVM
MSYFSACNDTSFISAAIFIIFKAAVTLQASMAKAENPWHEFSNREELVQLAGYGEERLSTVLVTGTVLCEACLHGGTQLHARPVSGALVNVECHTGGKWSKTSSSQAVTDEYGDFLIDLPSQVHGIPNLERTCSVRVLRFPQNSVCRPAHARKQKALELSSVGNGIRNYSAGEIKFLQLTSKPLQACTQRGSSDKQIS